MLEENIKIIEGGICAVDGVEAAGTRTGKYGVSVILNENSIASAVFTSNKVFAAPIEYTKKIINNEKLSLIIANSGNANCFTGEKGLIDCESLADIASNKLNIKKEEIAIASTGVIGRKMPMDIISKNLKKSIDKLENSKEASTECAKAIMTTDTVHKELAIEVTLTNNEKIHIGGITKGTGMIAPNMGTMLCFLVTDAKIINKEIIYKSLKEAVDNSFNMIVVDGDESTNDIGILMANGKSNIEIASENNGDIVIDENFQKGLNFICKELAKKMARDGEGGSKFIEVNINGALSKEDARLVAKSVVSSSLVKSAIFGEDPNWGRIAAAIGYAGVNIDQNNISIAIESFDNKNNFNNKSNKVYLVKNGDVLGFEGTVELANAQDVMKSKNIIITGDLHLGNSSATAWGCDLTYDYVKINAEYTT